MAHVAPWITAMDFKVSCFLSSKTDFDNIYSSMSSVCWDGCLTNFEYSGNLKDGCHSNTT